MTAAAPRLRASIPSAPRTGKKIEDTRADDAFTEAGEYRSLHAIHRRPNLGLRNEEAKAAGGPGDHSHGEGEGVAEATGAISLGEAATSDSTDAGDPVASLGETGAGLDAGVASCFGFFFFA